jgi:hypothetical protein
MCRVSCTTGSGTVLSPAARLGGGRGGVHSAVHALAFAY